MNLKSNHAKIMNNGRYHVKMASLFNMIHNNNGKLTVGYQRLWCAFVFQWNQENDQCLCRNMSLKKFKITHQYLIGKIEIEKVRILERG